MASTHFTLARISGLTLVLSMIMMGCKLTYNFTGVPTGQEDGLETIAIELFGNEAPIIVPNLAQDFTEQLQDRFLSQSRLNLVTGSGDVNVSGSISDYRVTPVAISGNELAEQNRLTIAVRVSYENNVDNAESWQQTFSSFIDFDANVDFATIEQEQIEVVIEQLTQDIFNKSLGKW